MRHPVAEHNNKKNQKTFVDIYSTPYPPRPQLPGRLCFLGAKVTHPDILRGGHRNPYQLENAIKSGETVFLHISLGLNSLQGSCATRSLRMAQSNFVSVWQWI